MCESLSRPNVVDILTILRVVVIAEQADPQEWVAVILNAPPRMMVDAETVHPIPPPRIRGLDTGANGARDTAEVAKIRRDEDWMLPKRVSFRLPACLFARFFFRLIGHPRLL